MNSQAPNGRLVLESADHRARLDAKLRREFGEVVLAALDDPRTEDIVLNPDGRLWTKRQGSGFVFTGEMLAAQAQAAIGTIAAQRGTVANYDRPILETELPVDGSRFEGIVPPVVRRPSFAIRLRPRKVFTLEDYEAGQILSCSDDPRNQQQRRRCFAEGVRGLHHADIIRYAIRERKNILIVGSTGSGRPHWSTRFWRRSHDCHLRTGSSRLKTRWSYSAPSRTS